MMLMVVALFGSGEALQAQTSVITPQLQLQVGGTPAEFSVGVTVATPNAVIRYTLNGAEPTEADPVVASGGTVTLTANTTFKARAWDGNVTPSMAPSATATSIYNIFGKVVAGEQSVFALRFDGRVMAAGNNNFGALGDGTGTMRSTPVPVLRSLAANDILKNVVSLTNARNGGNLYTHTIAVKADGTVWAWGQNSYGQLGNGGTMSASLPVQVMKAPGQPFTGAVMAAGGYFCSYILSADGTVWAWGSNQNGQLGDGWGASYSYPAQVKIDGSTFLSRIVAIAAGDYHLLALDDAGKIWACGYNGSGQLGDGSNAKRYFATKVQTSFGVDFSGAVGVAAMTSGSAAVKADGTVWAWGANDRGQLGDGTTTARMYPIQTKVDAGNYFSGAQAVVGGGSHFLILKGTGAVWSVGQNANGQLGDGTTSNRSYPVQVRKNASTFLTDVASISAGYTHSVALDKTGTVYTWGAASNGQLGNGAQTSATSSYATAYAGWPNQGYTPAQINVEVTSNSGVAGSYLLTAVPVDSLHNIVQVDFYQGSTYLGSATGGSLQLAVTGLALNQSVSAIAYGGTGLSSITNSALPSVAMPTIQLEVGSSAGKLNVRVTDSTPGAVIRYTTNGVDPTPSDPVIASGGVVGVGSKVTFKAKAWDGSGSMPSSSVATAVYDLFPKVAAGGLMSYVIKHDRTAMGTGNNYYGQAGDGTKSLANITTPVKMRAESQLLRYFRDVTSIEGGNGTTNSDHMLIAKRDGTVWASGNNLSGQLGNGGSPSSSTFPVQVLKAAGQPLTGVIQAAAGDSCSYALCGDGTVWAWGLNSSGQLGDGTTTTRTYATQVKTGSAVFLTGIVAIAAGNSHLLAMDNTGKVWASGANSAGQIGDGTSTARSYAVKTQASAGIDFIGATSLAAGSNYSLVVKGDGSVWSWGSNASGQLGDGSATTRVFPVQVKANSTTFFANATSVAAGTSHSLILKKDGTLWAFGLNSSGHLGDGTASTRSFPVQVKKNASTFLTNVSGMAAGHGHSVAVDDSGTVYTWGLASSGQLGNGATSSATSVYATAYGQWTQQGYTQPQLSLTVESASSGNPTSFLLTASPLDPATEIVRVDFYQGASLLGSVSSGPWQWLATGASLSQSFSAVAYNSAGLATTVPTALPIVAAPSLQLVSAGSGAEYGVRVTEATPNAVVRYTTNGLPPTESDALVASGSIVTVPGDAIFKARAWDGNTPASLDPSAVKTMVYHPVGAVGAKGNSSYALRFDGRVLATTATAVPPSLLQRTATADDFFGNAVEVVGPLAVKRDGTVWAWGSNFYGQLGDGSTTNSTYPVQVSKAPGIPLTGVTNAVATERVNYALGADGTVWAWGYNLSGELGDGSTEGRTYAGPVKTTATTNLSGIVAIAAGYNRLYALDRFGKVWACGYNGDNLLGLGTGAPAAQLYAVKVQASVGVDLNGVVRIAAGSYSGFAVKGDGSVWSWGNNSSGQLGDGTTTQRTYPVQVMADAVTPFGNAVAVKAAESQLFILKNDGTLWGVGANGWGQLGDGTSANRSNPVCVRKDASNFLENLIDFAVGASHGIALDAAGTVYTWGAASSYQLGNAANSSPTSAYATAYPQWPALGYTQTPLSLAVTSTSSTDPGAFLLTATSSNANSDIVRVDFYQGSILLGSVTSGPWQLSVTGASLGQSFSAVAYGSIGAASQTASVQPCVALPSLQMEPGTTPQTVNIRISNNSPNAVIHYRLDGLEPTENDPSVTSGGVIELNGNTTVRAKGFDGSSTPVLSPGPTVTEFYNLDGQISLGNTSAYVLQFDGRVLQYSFGAQNPSVYVLRQNYPVANEIFRGGTSLDAGVSHVLATKRDGTVWSSGSNSYGQLGDGTVAARYNTFGQVLKAAGQPLTGGLSVCATNFTSYALCQDGSVWKWGDSSASLKFATRIPGLPPIRSIAAHSNGLLAVDESGKVWLGSTLVQMSAGVPLNEVRSVAADGSGFYALRYDGSVVTWTTGSYPTLLVSGDAVKITTGDNTAFILKNDGSLWARGTNLWSQLGDGTYEARTAPIRVKTAANTYLSDIVSADGGQGDRHSGALDRSGNVYFWGNVTGGSYAATSPGWPNFRYALPQGELFTSTFLSNGLRSVELNFVPQSLNADVARVDFYEGNTFLGSATSGSWQWSIANSAQREPFYAVAYDYQGMYATAKALPPPALELVAGASATQFNVLVSQSIPGAVIHYTVNGMEPTESDPIAVSGGLIPIQGNVIFKAKVWDGSGSKPSLTTTRFYNLTGQVVAGVESAFAMKFGEEVRAVGGNYYGQLADGTNSSTPRRTVGPLLRSPAVNDILRNCVSFDVKYRGWAVMRDGTLLTWGQDAGNFPTTVLTISGQPLTDVIMTAASWGGSAGYALRADGTVWAMGSNTYGELGDATSIGRQYAAPVKINSSTLLRDIVQIDAGEYHLIALDSQGKVWTVGYNSYGQLGDGTNTNRGYAAKVNSSANVELSDVAFVAAGANVSACVKRDGTAWAWGDTNGGAMGSAATVGYLRQIKADASLNFTGVSQVAVSRYNMLLLKTDGTLWSQGSNTWGEVGDGTTTARSFPVRVKKNASTYLNDVVSFSPGFVSVALDKTGQVYTWGYEATGALGNGNILTSTSSYATAYSQWANTLYTATGPGLTVQAISGSTSNAFLLTASPNGAPGEVTRIDFYQGSTFLGSVTGGLWQLQVTNAALDKPFTAIAYGAAGQVGIVGGATGNVVRFVRVPLSRLGHGFHWISSGSEIPVDPSSAEVSPISGVDGSGRFIPSANAYVEMAFAVPGMGHFWIVDETTGEFSQLDAVDLRETPWAFDEPYVVDAGIPASLLRNFTLPLSRAKNALGFVLPDSTTLPVTIGNELWANGINPATGVLEYRGLSIVTGSVNPVESVSGFRLLDLNTTEQSPENVVDLGAVTWEPIQLTAVTRAAKIALASGNDGQAFTFHTSGRSLQGRLAGPVSFPSDSYSGVGFSANVGIGEVFWVTRNADGLSSPRIVMGDSNQFVDWTNLFPAVRQTQTTRFHVGANRRGHVLKVVQPDGYFSLLNVVSGANTLKSEDQYGAPVDYSFDAYDAVIDVNQPWTLQDDTTSESLGSTWSLLEGWAPLHGNAPTGHVGLGINFSRRAHPLLLRQANGTTYEIEPSAAFADTQRFSTFACEVFTGAEAQRVATVRYFEAHAEYDVNQAFTIVDQITGEEVDFAAGTVWADLSQWGNSARPVTIDISVTRWNHDLILLQADGWSAPVRRGNVQGSWTPGAAGKGVFTSYEYFDATSVCRPGLAWWIYDATTGEVARTGEGDLSQWIGVSASADGDHDGLFDWDEFLRGTDPNNEDTDGDGTNDGQEVAQSRDPLVPDNGDSDGDGIPNEWELAHGLNPYVADAFGDPDGDGVTNRQEFLLGTDPQVAADPSSLVDSDSDGIPDAYEALFGMTVGVDDSLEDNDGDRIPNIFEWKRATRANVPEPVVPDAIVDPVNGGANSTDNVFATISEAVSQQFPYAIVKVKSGRYNEQLSVLNEPKLILGEWDAINGPAQILLKSSYETPAVVIGNGSVIDGLVISHEPGSPGRGVDSYSNFIELRCRLVNCVIRDNSAEISGGIGNFGANLELVHCTVTRNQGNGTGYGSENLGRAIHNSYGTIQIINSIVWGNTGSLGQEISSETPSDLSVTESIIFGGEFGGINSNPMLTIKGWLKSTSPAINRPTASLVSASVFDIQGERRNQVGTPDLGADEYRDDNGMADGDGLPDFAESSNAPGAADDADLDGLTNAAEYELGTNGRLADMDGDGAADGVEVGLGTDPFNADTDGDQIPDGYEIAHALDPFLDDSLEDNDRDRVPNIIEWKHGTSAGTADAFVPDVIVDPATAATSTADNIVSTIGEAMNRISSGYWDETTNTWKEPQPYAIIYVKAGVYVERVTVSLTPVLILGELGAVRGPVQLRSDGFSNHALELYVQSVVDGLVISHAVDGAVYAGSWSESGSRRRRLVNCVIRDNQAESGAAIMNASQQVELVHCTITGNRSNSRGRAIWNHYGSTLRIENSIVWGNGGDAVEEIYNYPDPSTTVLVTESIVAGGEFGGINTTVPFLTAEGWLKPGAPAINRVAAVLPLVSRVDIHGQRRDLVGTPDLGAEEYVDSDGDSLADWWEIRYFGDLSSVGSGTADADGDGVDNQTEFASGTNPNLADTDGDGLSDGDELAANSDPFNPDTDGDGMLDGYEVQNGLNALVNDRLDDKDGDRIPNVFEWKHGTNPSVADAFTPDLIVDPATAALSDSDNIFATISEAVTFATTGVWNPTTQETEYPAAFSIIEVKSGTYDERIVLDSGVPVAILGESQGRVIVRGTNYEHVVSLGSESVIDGLVITHRPGSVGPAIYASSSYGDKQRKRRLVNCIIRGNTGQYDGAIYSGNADLDLVHCTVTGNSGVGPTVYVSMDSTLRLVNSIIWGNTSAGDPIFKYWYSSAIVSVTESIIQGGSFGGINGDPLLTGEGLLQVGSAAINRSTASVQAVSRVDIHGERRDQSGFPDLGADEFVDTDSDGLPDFWEMRYFGNLTAQSSLLADPDGDGMDNQLEYQTGTHPNLADSDSDGLPDNVEISLGTDPFNPDTDGDGMADGWEVGQGFDPLASEDGAEDSDSDGILNYEEFKLGFDPHLADSDGDGTPDTQEDRDDDGLFDIWELRYFGSATAAVPTEDPDEDTLTNAQEQTLGTHPRLADSDGDGLDDGQEVALGTNPQDADSDNDGAADGLEVSFGSNPLDPDSDDDLMTDGYELANSLNPLANDAALDPDKDGLSNLLEFQVGTSARIFDSDGDGMSDGFEYHSIHLDPTHHNNGNVDSDGDGMTDIFESIYGFDPDVNDSGADTDGDGLSNAEEAADGSSPISADIDEDGLNDKQEKLLGTDPWQSDTDGDGLSDLFEVTYGLNPLVYQAPGTDTDGDGLTDLEESKIGSDPNNPDTDGDGTNDGPEISQGGSATDAGDSGQPVPGSDKFKAAFEVWRSGKTVTAGCAVCHDLSVKVKGERELAMGETISLKKGKTYEVSLLARPNPSRPTSQEPPHDTTEKYTLWPQALEKQQVSASQDETLLTVQKEQKVEYYVLNDSKLFAKEKDYTNGIPSLSAKILSPEYEAKLVHRGFDPAMEGDKSEMGDSGDKKGEGWAAVINGDVNNNVAYVLGDGKGGGKEFETESKTKKVVDVTASTAKTTNLSLKITAVGGSSDKTIGAGAIGVRPKGGGSWDILNTLVLPKREVTVSVWYVEDSRPIGIPAGNTAPRVAPVPLRYQDITTIQKTLNDIYTPQTGITFKVGTQGNGRIDAPFDGAITLDGLLDTTFSAPTNPEIHKIINGGSRTHLNLYIVRAMTIPPGQVVPPLAITPREWNTSFIAWQPYESGGWGTLSDYFITCAHEIGHQLLLSTRGSMSNAFHDEGKFPSQDYYESGQKVPVDKKNSPTPRRLLYGLMGQGSVPGQWKWLRHEDWKQANQRAAEYRGK